MNANELADWLEYKSALTEYSCVKEAAKQLRQQQAEIEALKADLKYFTDPCNPLCKPSICDCYQARFAIRNRKAQEK